MLFEQRIAAREDLDVAASMDIVRCDKIQCAMEMLFVVPRHELRTERFRGFEGVEVLRIDHSSLQGREEAFREGIVIARMRPAVTGEDATQLEHRLKCQTAHRFSIVCMHDDLSFQHAFRRKGAVEKVPGKLSVFDRMHRPTDDFA